MVPARTGPLGARAEFKPGEILEPEGPPLPAGVSSALFVNLLTEDNLPHYFHTIRAGRWHRFPRWASGAVGGRPRNSATP